MSKSNNTEKTFSVSDDSGSEEEDGEEECPDCGVVFAQMNQLADHFMTHHQDKPEPTKVTSIQQVPGLESIDNFVKKSVHVADNIPALKKIEPSQNKPIVNDLEKVAVTPSAGDVSTVVKNDNSSEESVDTYENMLARYIQENDLPFIPRFRNRSDGNCWYEAIADQVVLHSVANLPTDHAGLRKAVCDALLFLPQAKAWIKHLFGGKKNKFLAFIDKHRKDGQWTDAKGLMCQATALLVKRNIHIVGTANMDQKVCYTKLESVSEADKMPPMNVGYYQNKHYQSLEKINMDFDEPLKSVVDKIDNETVKTNELVKRENSKEALDKVEPWIPPMKIVGKVARQPIAAKPLRKVVISPSNSLTGNPSKKLPEQQAKSDSIKITDNFSEQGEPVLTSRKILPMADKDDFEKDFKSVENELMKVHAVNTIGKSSDLQSLATTAIPSDNMFKTSKLKDHLKTDKKIEEINKLLNRVTKAVNNENDLHDLPAVAVPQGKMPRTPIASQPPRKTNFDHSNNANKLIKSSDKNAEKHNANKLIKSCDKNAEKPAVTEPMKQADFKHFKIKKVLPSENARKEFNDKNVVPNENLAKEVPHERGLVNSKKNKVIDKIKNIPNQETFKKSATSEVGTFIIENKLTVENKSLSNGNMSEDIRQPTPKIISPIDGLNAVKKAQTLDKSEITEHIPTMKSFKISKKAQSNIPPQQIGMKPQTELSSTKISKNKPKPQMSLITRRKLINDAAFKIQRWFRHKYVGIIARKNFLKKRNAAVKIQSLWRSFLARKETAKIKAAITLQSKWRSFVFRRRFLRTKKAAGSIQKIFRKNRQGKVFRREFLRKRKAALTIQSHWRIRLAELNGPCFQLLAPDEHYIDPETGELQLVNDYIINPETGNLEKSQVNLEVYVARLNRFLDFQALRKMAITSWKKTPIRTDLGTQFRNSFSQVSLVNDTKVGNDHTETETVKKYINNDEKKIDISMKPSKKIQNDKKVSGSSKWKKLDLDETFFTGVLPEVSHWKIPFNVLQNDKSDDKEYEDLDNLCSVKDEVMLNLSSNSSPVSFESCIEEVEEENSDNMEGKKSTETFYRSYSFTDLQKNTQETTSWLERSLEAKQEMLVKSATTIQSCWRGVLERRKMESVKIVFSVLNKIVDNAIGPMEVAKDVIDGILDKVVHVKTRASARTSKSKILSYSEDPVESELIESDENKKEASSMLLFSTFHADPLSESLENENTSVRNAKESSNKKRKSESEDEDFNVIDLDGNEVIEINESPNMKRKTRTFTEASPSNKKKTRTNSEVVYLEENTDEEDDDLDDLYDNKPTKRRRSSLPPSPQDYSANKDPKCFKCSERFGRSNLKNHILSHYYESFSSVCPNEKPFACPECGKSSRDRITTMRHFAFSHHKIYQYTEVTPELLRLR